MSFLDILVVFSLDLGKISFNLVEKTFATRQLAFLATGIAFYDISGFSIFGIFFFTFPFSPFLFFLLQWLTFYWKASLRRAIFSMEQPGVVAGNFGPSFSFNFLSIFVHISVSTQPITPIWASLKISFPPAEVEYRWCLFCSKVMTSEVEEGPRLVTAGYGRHRSQWVKHLPTGPKENSEFCFPETLNVPLSILRSKGNKTHCFLRDPSWSVLLYLLTQK